jgi:hypothetical protein
MNANLSKTTPLLVRLAEAISKLHFTIKVEVPEGYQDENGFHYGKKPAVQQITWPPRD